MAGDRARRFWIASLGAAILLHPTSSFGYARAFAQQNQNLTFWASSCALVTIYANGYTRMTSDQIAKSIAGAARAWSPEVVDCPAVSDGGVATGHPSFEIITQMAAAGSVPNVGPDGKNAVIFRTDAWEYGAAIALTLRSTDPSGRIFDADIEIDATGDVIWTNLDPNADAGNLAGERTDLQTAITHEFGHFLGLAHTCYDKNVDPLPQPVDDQGRLTPLCTEGLPEEAAVMWYSVDKESTTKRVLSTDDERGVCAIYPPNAAVPACTANLPDDGCGCRTEGPSGTPHGALFALAALMMARRRRR